MDHDKPLGLSDSPGTPAQQLPNQSETPVEAGQPAEEDEPTRLEYLKNMLPPSKPKRHVPKWLLWTLLAIVVVALLGGGAYWYLTQHKTKAPAHEAATAQTVEPAKSAPAGTTHYVSNGNDLNLDFDYPSAWTVTPPSGNNSNDQTITLTSPLASITTESGTVTGKVVVTIRPGTASLTELSGSTTAAQASVQFAYSKPTSQQHQYSYLTFLHTGAAAAASFQEVLVTGTTQFPQGTSITQSSVSVDPIISASFYSCTTQACTGGGASALNITNDDWQNDAIFQQSLAVLESMQLN